MFNIWTYVTWLFKIEYIFEDIKLTNDLFDTLRKIHKNTKISQSELAGDAGFNLEKWTIAWMSLKKRIN